MPLPRPTRRALSALRRIASSAAAIGTLGTFGLAAFLTGCGPVTVREISAARWVAKDSSLVYILHDFKVGESGGSLGRPDHNDYPYNRLSLYWIELGPKGLRNEIRLNYDPNAVPCDELIYRPQDSLLFYSYLVADGLNGINRHFCGDTTRTLAIGKLKESISGSKRWIPLTGPVDTALYLNLLRQGRLFPDLGIEITNDYEQLCANGWCLYPDP
jgi:hypothetical protein